MLTKEYDRQLTTNCPKDRESKIMKVFIPSYGPTLDSRPQPVFGRCEFFLFVDPASLEFESVPNPNASGSDDSGILSAQLVVDKGASVIIADSVGEKARSVLDVANVEIVPSALIVR
jgi:predicted Fe-Mo cluster-binding NifX family protein